MKPHDIFIRSAMRCSLLIVPMVSLIYLLTNSQDFRDWLAYAAWFIFDLLMLAGSISAAWHFALIAFVYWMACVILKIVVHQQCLPIVAWLLRLQTAAFVLSFIMAPGIVAASEHKFGIALLYIVHLVAFVCLFLYALDKRDATLRT